jgi:hypothetical protein
MYVSLLLFTGENQQETKTAVGLGLCHTCAILTQHSMHAETVEKKRPVECFLVNGPSTAA